MLANQDCPRAVSPSDHARYEILLSFDGPVANWATKRNQSAEFRLHSTDPKIQAQVVARRWSTDPQRAEMDLDYLIRNGHVVAFHMLTEFFGDIKIPINRTRFVDVHNDKMLRCMIDYATDQLRRDKEFVDLILRRANALDMPMAVGACNLVLAADAWPGDDEKKNASVKRPADGAESPAKRATPERVLMTAADVVHCCQMRDAAYAHEFGPVTMDPLYARRVVIVDAWMAAKSALLVQRIEQEFVPDNAAMDWRITPDGKFAETDVRLDRDEWFTGFGIPACNVSRAVRKLLDDRFARHGVMITIHDDTHDGGLDLTVCVAVPAAQ